MTFGFFGFFFWEVGGGASDSELEEEEEEAMVRRVEDVSVRFWGVMVRPARASVGATSGAMYFAFAGPSG